MSTNGPISERKLIRVGWEEIWGQNSSKKNACKTRPWWSHDDDESKCRGLLLRAETKVMVNWMWASLKHTALWYLPKRYPTWGKTWSQGGALSLLGWHFGVICKKQVCFVPQNLISICKRFSNHNINYASNSCCQRRRAGY